MKILLLGYGNMGKEIEKISIERGHQIAGTIDQKNSEHLTTFNTDNTDVAIEFSEPSSAVDNINYCIKSGIPVVSGTTGWLDKFEEVVALCKAKNGTFFYASNFSIGVNLFFQLNNNLAKMMASQKKYNISIEEIHHTHKKDAPSGTAITLAEDIMANSNKYAQWYLDNNSDDGIPIKSLRIDPTPGTHTVKYSSEIDDIEIKHTAHSRKGFATGAVMVAEWIRGKKGVLSMSDFFKNLNFS